MSKNKLKNIAMLGLIGSSIYSSDFIGSYMSTKELEGSPIYIPKRHKFKKRNRR